MFFFLVLLTLCIIQYKNKTVMASARSLINLYRDIYPGLLHSMLRGKTAAMEVSRNEVDQITFFSRSLSRVARDTLLTLVL